MAGTGQEGGTIDRHEKLTESYFKNPAPYRKLARKRGVSETELLESRIPPKHRSKIGASVVEVMMWHRHKVDLLSRGYSNASPVNEIGDLTSEEFNKTTDAKLYWEWNEDSFCRTLQMGCSPEELAEISPDTRNPGDQKDRLATLAGLGANTAENPYDEQPMILSKQWSPQIDYRRIVSRVQNTSRQTVRIPYNTTEEGDVEEMDVTPEGVAPLVVELGYSRQTLDFTGYGATLIATDDYLLDNQTTAEAIREEVMKLAMRRREALFHSLIIEVYIKRPSANFMWLGTDTTGEISSAKWNLFRKKYENYNMDLMLGTPLAISDWEDMYFGTGGDRTVTMEFFARRGRGTSPGQLNETPTIPDYGWVSREDTKYVDTAANIGTVDGAVVPSGRTIERFVITFDRRHTLRVWFRRGLAQDEMERIPGERKMARHFHTDVGYIVPDANGIWMGAWQIGITGRE